MTSKETGSDNMQLGLMYKHDIFNVCTYIHISSFAA